MDSAGLRINRTGHAGHPARCLYLVAVRAITIQQARPHLQPRHMAKESGKAQDGMDAVRPRGAYGFDAPPGPRLPSAENLSKRPHGLGCPPRRRFPETILAGRAAA